MYLVPWGDQGHGTPEDALPYGTRPDRRRVQRHEWAARAIGSAGERLVHTEEVTGSIPVSPTSIDLLDFGHGQRPHSPTRLRLASGLVRRGSAPRRLACPPSRWSASASGLRSTGPIASLRQKRKRAGTGLTSSYGWASPRNGSTSCWRPRATLAPSAASPSKRTRASATTTTTTAVSPTPQAMRDRAVTAYAGCCACRATPTWVVREIRRPDPGIPGKSSVQGSCKGRPDSMTVCASSEGVRWAGPSMTRSTRPWPARNQRIPAGWKFSRLW